MAKPGKPRATPAPISGAPSTGKHDLPAIDVTAKMYIGGKQARADNGLSYSVIGKGGAVIGQAAYGSRKDIRNAVEAAAKATGWGGVTGHNRAQVLYYLAENLEPRRDALEALLIRSTGVSAKQAQAEVEETIRRCFRFAAHADKFDGAVHATLQRHVTLALNEPWGVMGLVCPDEQPLLSMLSLILPAIAMGNRVVVVASQSHPLLAHALTQVLETSDIPAGVVNLVTGPVADLTATLAAHDEVAALWYCGPAEGIPAVEEAACGNLKAVWAEGAIRDWLASDPGKSALSRATQIKTIWLPYGD
jgi:aldehyde dehydrogenase (NAD+)